ncbi:hypothetical protein [Pleurocapsa sp. FMAR1]|uniref:hypothetical protein n=1 Tax=Pleurocapsa sp. FMAR1 TaxID=3040204 RepID=UPI0029C63F23|nr:hypothetical protein [Pleurocapsa sp. FMAR1]
MALRVIIKCSYSFLNNENRLKAIALARRSPETQYSKNIGSLSPEQFFSQPFIKKRSHL